MSTTCTWTRTGAQLVLTWPNEEQDSATIQGGRVTLVAFSGLGGLDLVFEQQPGFYLLRPLV